MSSILFHIMSGPNNISKSMLGFLLARTAVEEGHKVDVFLSGDGVQLIRDTIIENLSGLGTGKLKEHMAVLKKKGVVINMLCWRDTHVWHVFFSVTVPHHVLQFAPKQRAEY